MGWLATGGQGSLVGDRYRLIERLGTGGMSVVWRGHDQVLGRAVAVKVLSPQLAGDSTFRDRLRLEALAAARLCHPHITGVFDFGESPLDEHRSVPYVVMELNEGESVAARLSRQGPLPWRDAVVIAAEVASALATAHVRGVVHRDVTPANVMLTGAGAKVVDFGISALIGQRDAAPDGSLLGTPAYLAPERLGGGHVSPAADVYALGLLLYRTLTGRLPWPAGNTTQALRAHLFADPEPVPSLPGMPAQVADLCLRCLAKQPEDRPGAAVVAAELAALVGLQPIIAVGAPASGLRPSPHPMPRPARAPGLRVRAGLRVARALRLGGPQPLGGGLFRAGGLLRSVGLLPDPIKGARLTDAVLAGRHRIQAGVATIILAAAVGLIWSSTREPVDVGTAQAAAAGAGPGAVVPHGTGCKVRYRVQRDSGSDFGAQVTVVNTGEHVLSEWSLEFSFAGGQRLTDAPKRLTQRGRKLLLRAKNGTKLRPGRSASVTLSGSYRISNPLPVAFVLNGKACQAEVLGAVGAAAPSAEISGGMPASDDVRKKPSPRKKDKATAPAPAKSSKPPAKAPEKKSGFSVTV
ncbi:serine/threonine-protein kinase [Actinoplanes sp. CA-051413]|uniref:serine/threonine-protein kinase n=1 Tax=Actinoplanes sp. CA-051413 TaxID=3239899 RepID=UPI003D98D789